MWDDDDWSFLFFLFFLLLFWLVEDEMLDDEMVDDEMVDDGEIGGKEQTPTYEMVDRETDRWDGKS